jgi:hypothetical protein
MSIAEIDPLSITDIRADWIKNHLLDRGWKQRPYRDECLLVFEAPIKDDNGETILQTLPRSEKSPDFVMRASELIRILSIIENRPVWEVIRDIKGDFVPKTITTESARPENWNVSPRLLRVVTLGLFVLVLALLASNVALWFRFEANRRRTDEKFRDILRKNEPTALTPIRSPH